MYISIQTTDGPFRFPADCTGWTLLFYYGGDFQPVIATELMGLAELQGELRQNDCRILAVSADTVAVHLAFLENLSRHRGHARIEFPLGSDTGGGLQKALQLDPAKKYIWLLAPGGRAEAHFSYPHQTGANFTEVLRTLLALQTQRPTPYGWVPEAPTLALPPTTRKEMDHYMNEQEKEGKICVDWYICYE